jgi:hypothetical protein
LENPLFFQTYSTYGGNDVEWEQSLITPK